ncbi:MAG: hypothetical protein QOI76_293 [Frankiales bacterium]|jgi:hypothetical protein|nr:hypothetical protein [Frankiales bacterium]
MLCRDLAVIQVRYHLDIVREGAIMITVAGPGERWEVEFFDDDHVEVERFVSQGVNDGEADLRELLLLLQRD